MATFLRGKAHFSLWDRGNTEAGEFYFDIKDLTCITLGILLPVGPLQQDGLDFVRSFMKWLGHWSRDRRVQLPRHRLHFFAS